jgi:predicted N-acyltransferase
MPPPLTGLAEQHGELAGELPFGVGAIARIPTALWDGVAEAEVMASHGWLTALEQAGIDGLRPHYVLAGKSDRLGAAVCYETRDKVRGMDPTDYLLGRLSRIGRRLGLSFAPALVCAPYQGYSGHLLGRDRAAVLARVEALAAERGLPLLLPRVLDEDASLRELLLGRGYHRTVFSPVARLDIAWNSFDGYLASLRKRARSAARAEIRRCGEAGIAISEITDVAPLASRLHALADSHSSRRNGTGVPFGPAFFPALKAALGPRAVFYGAYRLGELIGFVLVLRDGEAGHACYIGMSESKMNFAYFNLGYYQPIRDGISAGLKRLYFGTLLYDVKVRRGCKVLPTSLYYRGASRARHLALAPLFRAHREWTSRFKLARVLALARSTAPR